VARADFDRQRFRNRSRFRRSALLALVSIFLAFIFPEPVTAQTVSTQSLFYGMCDASAAVALDNELFAVANDEDNSIRVYRANSPSLPIRSFNLSRFLDVEPNRPETDLEGATWLGDRIFWITSHGRNHVGKFRQNRHYLFATKWDPTTMSLVPVGKPYQDLLTDLLRDPLLKIFKLRAASRLAPKTRGALNIEALCATPNHHLLIGFRNPIPEGQALIVPLLNPDEILTGRSARFGNPIVLDLGGLGIRDLGYWQKRYIIVAGPYDTHTNARLFEWEGGRARPQPIAHAELRDLNAEAVIVYPDGRLPFQILSDDGTRLFGGTCCKQLADPTKRCFRSVWVTPAKPD